MGRRRTRTEMEMESVLKGLDPSSQRYRVLSTARDFKASWVALGEELTRVKETEHFKEWGYASFAAYFRRELHLRQDTVNKLTRSFSFVRDHEPDALQERSERELPPLDVVDLLSRAREKAQVSEDDLIAIRQEVFDPDAHPTRQQVVKRFREIDPEAFRSKPRIEASEPANVDGEGQVVPSADEVRKALVIAQRLQELVAKNPGMSGKARAGIQVVVTELEAQQESLQRISA